MPVAGVWASDGDFNRGKSWGDLVALRLPVSNVELLNEARAEMNVHLDERGVPDDFGTVDFPGLDHENPFRIIGLHERKP